mmetsp:Transcript_5609/g.11841  ORF Transcript_5609/g.11841 Transcript_5609/m.11841 type:complete len:473 (-) Transcript_5609:98-1516(-)
MRCAELGLIFCSFVVDVVSHRLAEDTLEVVGTSLIQRSLSLQKAHPWIGKNGDVLRQGSTVAVAATHLRKGAAWNWTAPLQGLVRASPVIDAEGSIYLSSINGVIYKFNQHGKELWQTNTGRGLPGNPVLYENSLFAVQDDCTFLALDPSNGKERWRAKGGDVFGPDTPSIIAEGARVFTACCDASEESNIGGATYVVAMDASNGQKLWTMRPENKVYNFLASVVDDSLLFADLAGGVYRLATSDGKVIWSHSAPEHASLGTGGLTTAPNGIAYVTTNTKDPSIGASRGVLSAYFITDGKLLWQKSLPLSANSGAAIGQKSPNTYFVTVALGPNPALPLPFPPKAFLDIEPLSPSTKDGLKPGKAMTFDAGSGEVLWSFDFPDWHGVAAGDSVDHLCLPDSFANPSIGGDGSVYIAGESGVIYRLKDSNGDGKIDPDEVDSFDTKNAFQGAPALSDGIVAAAPCNGLFVFLE